MPKPSQTFAKFRALIGQAGLHFSYWGEYFNVIFDMIYSCSPFFSRERLIHLLAVRPYKKPELLLRMYKGELNGNETRQGSPTQKCSQLLRPLLWNSVAMRERLGQGNYGFSFSNFLRIGLNKSENLVRRPIWGFLFFNNLCDLMLGQSLRHQIVHCLAWIFKFQPNVPRNSA